jgi:hypothetical protein
MLASFRLEAEQPHSRGRKPYLSSPKRLASPSCVVEICEECLKIAGAPGLDRLCLARRAGTFPLPEFYNMSSGLIPTAAGAALQESTTDMGFGGGDG